MSDTYIRTQLSRMFCGVGLGAALSEVATCRTYPTYLVEIMKLTGQKDQDVAILVWSIRRGYLWERF